MDLHPVFEQQGPLSGVTATAINDAGLLLSLRRYQQPFSFAPQQLKPVAEPVLQFFDRLTQHLVRQWGEDMFVLPHSITVAPHNALWITDCALQQVFKFNEQGELLLTLGQKRAAGCSPTNFNYPTDVAVLSNGNVLVSDGYLNARVVCFSAQGEYLYQWGNKGAAAGEFFLPHSLAVGDDDTVFVADRENRRIQAFSAEGELRHIWDDPRIGVPFAVALYQQYLLVLNNDYRAKQSSLVLIDRHSGDIDIQLTGQLNGAHEFCCDTSGKLYFADIYHQRILQGEPFATGAA